MSGIDNKRYSKLNFTIRIQLKGHTNLKQSYEVKRASELLHPNLISLLQWICFHLFKLLLMFSLPQPLLLSLLQPIEKEFKIKQKSDSWFKLNAFYLLKKKPNKKTQTHQKTKTKHAHQNNTKKHHPTPKSMANTEVGGKMYLILWKWWLLSKSKKTEFTWKAFQTAHLAKDAGVP